MTVTNDVAEVPAAAVQAGAGVPAEEIRLAVVLNGGVSLAVWMGGTALELDRLAQGRGGYGALLALAGCRARIDVIAGTSAGGINGAALALAQANRSARLAELRDVWTDQGQIETLLRTPFRGSPTSLLQGDEYFLPRLNEAMHRLVTPFQPTDPQEHPIDLTITTTLLHGAQKLTTDSAGQRLPQWVHDGRFRFRRDGETNPDSDPFGPGRISATADQLGLAARCTASFPVAFEPSFVPVDRRARPSNSAEAKLRPDMAGVASWASENRDEPGWQAVDPQAAFDVSRFAVDGGLLANMPTRPALSAVDAMQAGGPVRRVMLLIHPHAPAEQAETADDPTVPPTVAQTITGILGALSAQGSRTFVEQIEAHNLAAAGRRGTRTDVLATVDSAARLHSLAAAVFEQYRKLRMWRAGRDVAAFIAPQPGWNPERIRRNARSAQEQWYAQRRSVRGNRPPLPYVPAGLQSAPPTGWAWGVSAAIGLADAAADLMRRLVWVLPAGAEYDTVHAARLQISTLRREIKDCRELTDGAWRNDPVLSCLEPTETLFTLRLAWYEWAMLGSADPAVTRDLRTAITGLIANVAQHEGQRVGVGSDAPARVEQVRNALYAQLLGEGRTEGGAHNAGAVGARVRELVEGVVAQIQAVLPVLVRVCAQGAVVDHDSALLAWARIFTSAADAEDLLQRLLALEVTTTALGDEVTTEYSLPLELVQLSAQTADAFATATRTADDKLGGMALNRFGGFLKRSWRLNDWAWGRMDAATVLCRLVCDPARIRRAAELSGRLQPGTDAQLLAQQALQDLLQALFPGPAGSFEVPPIPDFNALLVKAHAELAAAYAERPGDLGPCLPHLAELAAWAAHLTIITEELPALARAVKADGVAGANPRSNGELMVVEHADLIARLDARAAAAPGGEVAGLDSTGLLDAVAALRVFDRAGVGRESLREEGSSDQMLRTATSAAAVAATLADSDAVGIPAVKPVTRSLRGFMLLPYWLVSALTSGGALARALALLGLSIGAVLLALSLFGALPGWASGVGAAAGASALLVAFAYGALRTSSLLHSVVLLSPVIPLLAFAAERSQQDGGGGSARLGLATLLTVVALALGLMILGSLPAPVRSVFGTLDDAADRAGLAQVSPALRGSGLASAQSWRRFRALLRMLLRPVGTVVMVAAVAAAVVVAVNGRIWLTLADEVASHRVITGLALAGVAVLGMVLSWRAGQGLRLAYDARNELGADVPVWRYHPVRHPVGVMVGWSALYGTGYLLLAVLLLADPWNWLADWWGKAMLVTALLFAVVLLLVVPLVAPLRAKRAIERTEAESVYEGMLLGRAAGQVDIRGLALTRRGKRLAAEIGESIDAGSWPEEVLQEANRSRLLRDLVDRGRSYRFLVKTSTVTAEDWSPTAWGADAVTVTFGQGTQA